jgi:uncharacterized protein (DUF433 family)
MGLRIRRLERRTSVERVSVEPGTLVCGGRPCIKAVRWRASVSSVTLSQT